LALGLGVLAAALTAGVVVAGPSASQSGSSDVLHGHVEWDGTTPDAATWRVHRSATGEYRVDFDGDDVQLDVERWDAVADATVIPMGDGADIVRFTNDTGPVDTSFSFTAIVGG
jgi:hypothetical protein